MPEGQFRVGERSAFYQFWLATKLDIPQLSAFHDRLGNLKKIVLTAEEVETRENRLNAQTLRPLSVSAEEISSSFWADMRLTMREHVPDSGQTSVPDNTLTQSQQAQAMQSDPATCAVNRENELIRAREYKGWEGNRCQRKRPENQTDDEWLADYESAEGDLN